MSAPLLRDILATPGLTADDVDGVPVDVPSEGRGYALAREDYLGPCRLVLATPDDNDGVRAGFPGRIESWVDPHPETTIADTRAGRCLVATALALRLGVPREAIGATAPGWSWEGAAWFLSPVGWRDDEAITFAAFPADGLAGWWVVPGIDTADPWAALCASWGAVVAPSPVEPP